MLRTARALDDTELLLQELEPVACNSQLRSLAILQVYAVGPAERTAQFSDVLQVHQRRSMNALEAQRIQGGPT